MGVLQNPDCLNSHNIQDKIGECEVEDDKGMVMEDECVICVQTLSGRLVLISIRAGVLVLCSGSGGGRSYVYQGISLVCDRSGVFRSDFLVGGRWYLRIGGHFVAVVVEVKLEDLELVVKAFVGLVWGSVNDRT